MQAIYSGFSYIGSEARRATKPIIEDLAPIISTSDHDEPKIKQSLGKLINEIEDKNIKNTESYVSHPLLRQIYTNITKIRLYPASRQSQLNTDQGCRIPNEQEWDI